MSRTRRKQPMNREEKRELMEEVWEHKVQQQRTQRKRTARPPRQSKPSPAPTVPSDVEQIRAEATAIVNERVKAANTVPYSVQSPGSDDPTAAAGSFIWWTGGNVEDYLEVAKYGSGQRQADLRAFTLVAPLCMNAIAAMTKKAQALQWNLEAGRNLAIKWQRKINDFEGGRGWDFFIARWVRAYCECDTGGFAELIRAAPKWAVDERNQLTPRGARALERGDDKAWEIVDCRVMDPVCCHPTQSNEWPLLYDNPNTGRRHKLRAHQFMHLLDMPGVDDRLPGYGLCGVSRAVYAAQEDRMVIRYAMEAMSENPGVGIALVNANTTVLETALTSAKAERAARGVVYYKGVVFLPIMDPSGSLSLEYLSFSHLPDNFNRLETYNIVKEIVATAFGLDVLELGSLPAAGGLGSGKEVTVAATKAQGKGIGSIIQAVEGEFGTKLLPPTVQFEIERNDAAEERDRADTDKIYFENAARMVQTQTWTPELANQYLADQGAIPNEAPYLMADMTPETEIDDTEATDGAGAQTGDVPPEAAAQRSKRWYGPRVRVNRKGKVEWLERALHLHEKAVEPLRPAGGPLPEATALEIRVSPDDIDRAVNKFDVLFPELSGLLDAKV